MIDYVMIYNTSLCRLNVSVGKVTSGDRERAKRVVYAIVYGVGERVTIFS